MKFISSSPKKTKEYAALLARTLIRKMKRKHALVVALNGELGVGKTVFVQGFALGMGIKRRMVSPTFTIMRRCRVQRGGFRNFFHVDAYRVKDTKSVKALDLQQIFFERSNIVVIEWPRNINRFLPKGALGIKMEYGRGENERIITLPNSKPEAQN